MAEIKISALNSATSITGTEAVPIVQGGVTKRTSTQDIANLLAPAINVVSQALSVEQDSRANDISRLSNQISDIISAGGGAISVTSNKLSAASAALNFHINVVSLNLETEIADRKSAISSPSALTSAGASVHGLQSIVNALSDRIAGVAAGAVSVTSNELSAAAAALSNRVSIASAVASVAELHASTASDAATSANLHANAASAAATSVLNYICAASVVSGATSVRGLQSIFNNFSNRISAAVAGVASVTSNELSAAAAALSNRISITSAVASLADVHASTASLAATSADNHANTASAAATSVLNYVCAVSVKNNLGNSIKGLQSAFNAVSARTASAFNNLSVTSTKLSAAVRVSAVSGATSVYGLQSVVNQLSNRISAIVASTQSVTSAELSATALDLSNKISGACVAASVAEAHANTASAAATSADAHANAASAAATSVLNYVDAVSVKSGATSVRGLQSVIQQLSAHINALSATPPSVSVTSNELSVALAISSKSGAGSVKGLQSVVNALSTRISAIVAGGTNSVTSNELSAAGVSLQTGINTVSAAIVAEINNRISADNVISNRVSIVSNALSIETARAISIETGFSNLLSAAAVNTASVLNALSNNMSIANAAISNLVSAHNVLSNRVSANSGTGGGGSVTSTKLSQAVGISARTTAAISIKGLQSVVNALSAKISAVAGGIFSVTSAELATESVTRNTLSVLVSNLVSAHNAASNVVSAHGISLQVVSNAASIADAHASVASLAATSADGHANAASAAATSIGNLLATLSARVDTNSAAFSVLNATVSNALSAGDVASANIDAISQRLSVLSAGLGAPQVKILTTTATISASGLTKISGLSAVLVSTGTYRIHAVLHHSHSTQGTNGFGFGVSSPAATTATGVWRGYVSTAAPAGNSAIQGFFNQAGFGSITYSATPTASAVVYRTELDMDMANVTSGRLQLKARSSATGVGAIDIRAGSYIQAFRIG